MKTTDKPEPTWNGLTFYPIPELKGLLDESRFFKRRELPKVPLELEKMARSLFFNGGELPEMPKCIDIAKAEAAVGAWFYSCAPAHEAKMVTVAYALWVWTTRDE